MTTYVLTEPVFSAQMSMRAGTKVEAALVLVAAGMPTPVATASGVIRDVAPEKLRLVPREERRWPQ